MSEHDPIKAQQKLEKAIDLSRVSKMPTGPYSKNEAHSDDDGSEKSANLNLTDANGNRIGIEYSDYRVGDIEYATDSGARVDEGRRRYRADITRRPDDKVGVGASVARPHGVHRFNEEHEEKAAALITSIAAKRLGERATQHADKVIDEVSVAREAFHSEQ